MKSPYFNEEHQLFRDSIRDFLKAELRPHFEEWEKKNEIPRWAWKRMGEMGFLGICHDEAYGGIEADMFSQVVFCEELSRTLNTGFAIAVSVHVYMATNHIAHAGNSFQKEKYLKPAIAGEKIAALGMSEPHVGSNVKGLKTFAEDKGDHYLVNGSKIFITNGYYADFMTLAADTEQGLSLFIVDLDQHGVTRNKLEKIGWHSSDTAEVFFDNVKVPKENLLGEAGQGFYFLSESLQMERLVLAMNSIGLMDATLELTQAYMDEREAFGKPLNKFQALRHRLVDVASELEAVRHLVYHTAWLLEQGEFAVKECSMAKLLSAELHKKLVDECLQMFGGYGYMEEFPIAQVYRDARAASIVGGTSEIMREIIAKMMFESIRYKRAYAKEK